MPRRSHRATKFLMVGCLLLAIYLLGVFVLQPASLNNRDARTGWVRSTLRKVQFRLNPTESYHCDSSGARKLPAFGRGCYLRDKLTCSRLPTIHSAFAEARQQEVVFVGVKRRDDAWDRDAYLCEYPNGEATASDPVVNDYRSFGGHPQYLVVVTCPFPLQFEREISRRRIRRFRVNLRLASSPWYAYLGVPVCLTEAEQRFLSVCTMVRNMAGFVRDWMYYYRQLGVEHVYIYDNAPNTTMPDELRDYVETGFLTIVPWAHTPSSGKSYLEVQIAHENDCLWRHRHNTQWMLKVDVDEFVQTMNPSKTKITDYLTDSRLQSLGTVRLRNWFFGRPLDTSRNVTRSYTVFERNPWRTPNPTQENRGRDKCIIRPINVHYFKIHGVKVGGDTLTFDPDFELRLVHYRKDNPRHRGFKMREFVLDESMIRTWRRMTNGNPVLPDLFKANHSSQKIP